MSLQEHHEITKRMGLLLHVPTETVLTEGVDT